MSNIVHIGLGKCATSTLQKSVFPLVAKQKGFTYNSRQLVKILSKSCRVGLTVLEIQKAQEILGNGSNFISYEKLASWNPVDFERAADRNLAVLGPDTTILITLRDPETYLRSVYQQKIHEGYIIPPEEFFVTKKDYDLAAQISSMNNLDYYCCDYLDYQHLYNLYKDRFENVCCVNIEKISSFNFLDKVIDFSREEKKELREVFCNSPRENISYSNTAMKLTFLRERWLNWHGLKTRSARDRGLNELKKKWLDFDVSPSFPSDQLKVNHSRFFTLKKIPRVVFMCFRFIFPKWRTFIQKRFDKLYPYKKYKLPPELKGINRGKIKLSKEFLKQLDGDK